MRILIPALVLLLASWVGCSRESLSAEPARSAKQQRRTAYAARIAAIDQTRRALAVRYRRAGSKTERGRVLNEAREAFATAVASRLAPLWFGTPWEFYGTTEAPGEGTIACGYFVSTVLRDAGLRVERVRMAQQAAENIIKSLTGERYIRRFSDRPLDQFVAAVEAMGDGLFVVGLDYHVGMLSVRGGSAWFLHSTSSGCSCALEERARDSGDLAASRYRVIGKISDDDRLILKWLERKRIATVVPGS